MQAASELAPDEARRAAEAGDRRFSLALVSENANENLRMAKIGGDVYGCDGYKGYAGVLDISEQQLAYFLLEQLPKASLPVSHGQSSLDRRRLCALSCAPAARDRSARGLEDQIISME